MELSTRTEGSVDIVSCGVKNPFADVRQKYVNAITRQTRRMIRQGRDFHTKKEQIALAFYGQAVMKIEAL